MNLNRKFGIVRPVNTPPRTISRSPSLSSTVLYLRLLRYVAPYKHVLIVALLGAIVVALTEPALPAIMKHLDVLSDAGLIQRTKTGRSVACGIASAMLQRGTQKRNREQLSNEFSKLKASVGVSGEGASIQTVRDNLPEALRLVAEILRQPSFPEAEFEQLKRASLTSLEAQRSDPGALATVEIRRHLDPYPQDHWLYSTSIDERIERIRNVRLDEVRACYQDFFGASNRVHFRRFVFVT